MEVKLIRHTLQPDELAGFAAAMCTGASDIDKARDTAMASGHDSILEHATFTFEVNDVSRCLLAQLTRHRLASYSVMSQRYVNQSNTDIVTPPSIEERDDACTVYNLATEICFEVYDKLLSMGIPKEDARFVLPAGTCTSLVLTMNARELRHFFSLRSCHRAQWEIRTLSDRMLTLCKAVAPALFADAGPGCVRGACPEARPCGHPRSKEEWESWR